MSGHQKYCLDCREDAYEEMDALRYAAHRDEVVIYGKAHLAAHAEAQRKYCALHPETNAEVQRRSRVLHPDRIKKWKQSPIGKESNSRSCARRNRNLGYVTLNQPAIGCEGHHINTQEVIYIPKDLHHSIPHNVWSGKGMEEINAKAFAWYTEDWT
jgi:hypothetical protein